MTQSNPLLEDVMAPNAYLPWVHEAVLDGYAATAGMTVGRFTLHSTRNRVSTDGELTVSAFECAPPREPNEVYLIHADLRRYELLDGTPAVEDVRRYLTEQVVEHVLRRRGDPLRIALKDMESLL